MDYKIHGRKILGMHDPEYYKKTLQDYYDLLDVLRSLINVMYEAKIQVDKRMSYAETILIKFSFISSSLGNLIEGTDLNSKLFKKKVFDTSSIYTLGRAQIENFLMYWYLYVQPKTEAEKIFRFQLYQLSGLSNRQQLKPKTIKSQAQFKKDKIYVDQLTAEIKDNSYFQNLTKQQRNWVLGTKPARIYGWDKLMQMSELNNSIAKTAWSMYSSYAHTEYWCILQLKDYYKDAKTTIETVQQALILATMLVCTQIYEYRTLYPSVTITYNALNPAIRKYIEWFDKVIKNKHV
jgi:hypothetical protein